MITYINLFENNSNPGKGELIGLTLGSGIGGLTGGGLGTGIYRALTTGEDPTIQIDDPYMHDIYKSLSTYSGITPGIVLGSYIGSKLGKKIDKK